MLKSRKSSKELERYVAILSDDCGEVLAESFAVRHMSGIDEEDYAVAIEKLKEGLLLFMTTGEFTELKRRIEAEGGDALPGGFGIDAGD
jgi:hypothetical protein